jgi:hypothetical protein
MSRTDAEGHEPSRRRPPEGKAAAKRRAVFVCLTS